MIEFIREENLNGMTQLVRFFQKTGQPYVLKKDVKALHPFLKDSLAAFVRDRPTSWRDIRTLKVLKAHYRLRTLTANLTKANLQPRCERAFRDSPRNANCQSLSFFYVWRPQFLFYPDLINPVKEHEINQGRKRVDIKFTNADEAGFFRRMAELPQTRSVNVFFECKNYSHDLGNPEIDQIIGRFSPIRGKLGFILCRTLVDESRMLERCRDAARDNHGFVIVLTDASVDEFLGFVERGQRQRISERLYAAFARLTTRIPY